MQWITDFSDRVKQLESISKLVADQGYKSLKVISFRVRLDFEIFCLFLFRLVVSDLVRRFIYS